MLKLEEEEKKLFFEDLTEVRRQYSFFLVTRGFVLAEEFKKKYMRRHILENKEKLISLRKKIYGSK